MTEYDTGSMRRVLALMELETPDDVRDINLTQAADYHAVEEVGLPRRFWADTRDVSEGAVRNSIRTVERGLGIRADEPDELEEGEA